MNIKRFLKEDVLQMLPPGKEVITDGDGLILVGTGNGEWIPLLPIIDFVKESRKNGCTCG